MASLLRFLLFHATILADMLLSRFLTLMARRRSNHLCRIFLLRYANFPMRWNPANPHFYPFYPGKSRPRRLECGYKWRGMHCKRQCAPCRCFYSDCTLQIGFHAYPTGNFGPFSPSPVTFTGENLQHLQLLVGRLRVCVSTVQVCSRTSTHSLLRSSASQR